MANKRQGGFTLIELLIIIALIGLLASIILVWMGGARAQSRDAQRVAETDALRKALEMYYDEHGDYPLAATWVKLEEDSALSNALKPWLPKTPNDPLYPKEDGSKIFSYQYQSTPDQQGYKVHVEMETGKFTTYQYEVVSGGGGGIVYGGGGGADQPSLFAGGNSGIFKCLTSTGCDASAEWVAVTGYMAGANDFAVDSTNKVIYAGADVIYRCVLATGCDAAAEWTTAFNTPFGLVESIIFDPVNGVLYAGERTSGRIYRCNVSTGCDNDADWTVSLTTTSSSIKDIILDTANNVLYASDDRFLAPGGSIVYRCPLSSGCDAGADWIQTFNGTGVGNAIWQMTYDTTNNVIYAAGLASTNGKLWRCDVTVTNCDAAADWTNPYSTSSTNFSSLMIANGSLYIGRGSTDSIERCVLSTGCDQPSDFATYNLSGAGSSVESLGYEPTGSVLYAGSSGVIYRCLASSQCDAAADWTVAANTTDSYLWKISYKP